MIRALLITLLCTLLATPASALESVDLARMRDTFDASALDQQQQRPISGVTLELPGLKADLSEGVLFAVVDGDNGVQGAVFVGEGQVEMTPSDELEGSEMQAVFGESPLVRSFSSFFLRSSDPQVRSLLGLDEAWSSGADNQAAFNAGARRPKLIGRAMGDYDPRLTLDLIRDEVEGSAGGHTYVEFRIKGSIKGRRVASVPYNWVSYYHNPRGAFFPTEPTVMFLHRERGSATQEVFIASSFGDPGGPVDTAYDMLSADLKVLPSFTNSGNAKQTTVSGLIRVRANDEPVPMLVFELLDRITWCQGLETDSPIEVLALDWENGTDVPATRVGDRIIVVPPEPITDEKVGFRFELSGQLSTSIVSDNSYTMLDDMAWYPRNPSRDRHRVTIEVTVPEWLNAVATGRLMDETIDSGNRTLKFRERRGVVRAAVSWGHFEVFSNDAGPAEPEIRLAIPQGKAVQPKQILQAVDGMLKVMSTYWGPYPMDALSITSVWNPSGTTDTGTGLATEGWKCPPPGDIYAWEAFARVTGGCINEQFPRGVPPFDAEEERVLDYLFDTGSNFHYLAHVAAQWWGQALYPRSYRDEWLITGMAHLTAALYMDAAGMFGGLPDRLAKWRSTTDQRSGTGPMRMGSRLAQGYPRRMFAHAPLLLYSINWSLPGTGFVDAIRATINTSHRGAIDSREFEKILRESLDTPDADILSYWTDALAVPNLEYNYEVTKEQGGTYSLSIEVSIDDVEALPMGIPIEIRLKKQKNPVMNVIIMREATTVHRIEGLKKEPRSVKINPENRVLIGQIKRQK